MRKKKEKSQILSYVCRYPVYWTRSEVCVDNQRAVTLPRHDDFVMKAKTKTSKLLSTQSQLLCFVTAYIKKKKHEKNSPLELGSAEARGAFWEMKFIRFGSSCHRGGRGTTLPRRHRRSTWLYFCLQTKLPCTKSWEHVSASAFKSYNTLSA